MDIFQNMNWKCLHKVASYNTDNQFIIDITISLSPIWVYCLLRSSTRRNCIFVRSDDTVIEFHFLDTMSRLSRLSCQLRERLANNKQTHLFLKILEIDIMNWYKNVLILGLLTLPISISNNRRYLRYMLSLTWQSVIESLSVYPINKLITFSVGITMDKND